MRIRVKLPQGKPHYITSYTLGIQELNYGNHLGNDKVLTLAHEARMRFFKSLNQNELNFFGQALIMGGAQIQYQGQGYYGEQLELCLWLGESNQYGFKIYTQITSGERKVASLETDMIFFDYDKQKVQKIPHTFAEFRNSL